MTDGNGSLIDSEPLIEEVTDLLETLKAEAPEVDAGGHDSSIGALYEAILIGLLIH
jgi:hypothetical protein